MEYKLFIKILAPWWMIKKSIKIKMKCKNQLIIIICKRLKNIIELKGKDQSNNFLWNKLIQFSKK